MSQECHGCVGRGHIRSQCPTANPSLKLQRARARDNTAKGDGARALEKKEAAKEAAAYPHLKMELKSYARLPSVLLTLSFDPELKRKAQFRVKLEKPPSGVSEKVHREKEFSKNKPKSASTSAKDESRQTEVVMAMDPKDSKLIKYLQAAISGHLAPKSKVHISVDFRSKLGSVQNPSYSYEVNVSTQTLRDKLFKMKRFLYYSVTVTEEVQDTDTGIKLVLHDNLFWKYKDGSVWNHGLDREQYLHTFMTQGLHVIFSLLKITLLLQWLHRVLLFLLGKARQKMSTNGV